MVEKTGDETSAPRSPTAWIIAAIAGFALLVSNVEALHKAWCDYIGIFCKFTIVSEPITAYSGGRDVPYVRNPECHEHSYTVTIRPTKWPRKLEVDSLKFIPTEVVGRYGNGESGPPSEAEVGWYSKSKSPDLIEGVVYSRTGACESKRTITGKFEVTEHNYLGW